MINLALADIVVARQCMCNSDIAVLNLGAFHLQQAVEKTLKFNISNRGTLPPKTHDIAYLIRILKRLGGGVPQNINKSRLLLAQWEANTRYNLSFTTNIQQMEIILYAVEDYAIETLKQNNIKYNVPSCIYKSYKRRHKKT